MAMINYNFRNSQGANDQIAKAVLVPGAPLAEVVLFNTSNYNKLVMTFKVSVAALTDVQVWARSNTNAEFFMLEPKDFYGQGRTDNSDDYNTTPAGQSGMIAMCSDIWAEVSLRMSSAGAARLEITAGVE